MKKTTKTSYGGSYSKMSMGQWVVLYLLLGALVYGAIYYFMTNKGMYGQTQETPVVAADLVTTKTDATKGDYLVDVSGMTLYIFDKDKVGVSNCTGNCLVVWPPFLVGTEAQTTLPVNVTTITRSDGSMQYAYKGMPLYYYASDTKPGDLVGDGVGGVWHLVKP